MSMRLWARGVILASAIVYMQVGPAAVSGLGIRTGPPFMSWRMYHSRGHDECKVWAYTLEDGGPERLDWLAALGVSGGSGQARVRHVRGQDDMRALGRRLCKATPVGTRVSIVMQCAERRYWQAPTDTLDVDLCGPTSGKRR